MATEPASELTTEKIIKLMVGRELNNQFPPKTNKPGDVVLEVEHLTAQYSLLNDVSFKVREGEIVGLAGLDGVAEQRHWKIFLVSQRERTVPLNIKENRY